MQSEIIRLKQELEETNKKYNPSNVTQNVIKA